MESAGYQRLSIYVIDNGSRGRDESAIIAQEFPWVDCIRLPENRGFTGGVNVGIQRALKDGCHDILLLNNDTLVRPHLVERLLDALDDNPQVGLVMPIVVYPGGERIWSKGGRLHYTIGLARNLGKGLQLSRASTPKRPPDFLPGCCLLISGHVLAKIGLLRDEYFAYYEDVDYSLRAKAAGFGLLVVDQPLVVHYKSASAGTVGASRYSPLQAYLLGRNGVLLARRALSGWRRTMFLAGQFGPQALHIALRSTSLRAFAAYVQGLRDGLASEPGRVVLRLPGVEGRTKSA